MTSTLIIQAILAGVTNGLTYALVGIGVAAKEGGKMPDLSSPDALKKSLIEAKSLTYSDSSTGGRPRSVRTISVFSSSRRRSASSPDSASLTE